MSKKPSTGTAAKAPAKRKPASRTPRTDAASTATPASRERATRSTDSATDTKGSAVSVAPAQPAATQRPGGAAVPTLALYIAQPPGSPPLPSQAHPAVRAHAVPVTGERHPAVPLLDGLLQLSAGSHAGLWGLLPPDFESRTGLSLDDFATAIDRSPGFDLYFVSAHPGLEAVHHNPWRSVEVSQPGFCAVASRLLAAAGMPPSLVDAVTPSTLFATGHLMVATPAFWQAYLRFLTTALDRGLAGSPHAVAEVLEKPADSPGQLTPLGLMAARLLSVFLMAEATTPWKACKFALPSQESGLNAHLRALRDLKDVGVSMASNSLLEGWLGYRQLYLLQAQGADWVQERLSRITPANLVRAVAAHSIERVQIPRSIQEAPAS